MKLAHKIFNGNVQVPRVCLKCGKHFKSISSNTVCNKCLSPDNTITSSNVISKIKRGTRL